MKDDHELLESINNTLNVIFGALLVIMICSMNSCGR